MRDNFPGVLNYIFRAVEEVITITVKKNKKKGQNNFEIHFNDPNDYNNFIKYSDFITRYSGQGYVTVKENGLTIKSLNDSWKEILLEELKNLNSSYILFK